MIETSTRREIFIASTSLGGPRFRTATPNNRDMPAMHPRIHSGSRWRLLLRPTAHRFASRAYRGTPNPRAVQVLLGHASIATTERYTAVDDSEIRAAMRPIDEVLEGYGNRLTQYRRYR